MAKLILFKREGCPYCIKFKEAQNYGALKEKLGTDSETKDIKFYEFESLKDIKDIKREINLAINSNKIDMVPTLCLFYEGKKFDIIDIELWKDINNNLRDVDGIFDNIKKTLTELKKTDYKNKYIKYKNKYLELKNKYLQQKNNNIYK
jgi:glutaredoxin